MLFRPNTDPNKLEQGATGLGLCEQPRTTVLSAHGSEELIQNSCQPWLQGPRPPCTKSGSYRHVHIYMREEKDSASYECARDARRFLPEAAALFEDGADRFFFEEETSS